MNSVIMILKCDFDFIVVNKLVRYKFLCNDYDLQAMFNNILCF